MTLNPADIIQFIGIAAVFGMSIIFVVIAAEKHRFTHYGREALFAAAGFLFTLALMRLLYLTGTVGLDLAREANGIFAFVFLVISAEAFILHRRESSWRAQPRNQEVEAAARRLGSIRH